MKRILNRVLRDDPRKFPYTPKRTPRRERYWNLACGVLDQGETPQCVGYAAAHSLAFKPGAGWIPPDAIYWAAQRRDAYEGEDYEGTSVLAAMDVLYHLGRIRYYEWATTAEQVANAVLSVGPVLLGVTWKARMDKPDGEFYVRPKGRVLGGHAIVCDGWDEPMGCFRLLNSWGKDYGLFGHVYVTADDMDALLSDDGEAAVLYRPSSFGAFPEEVRSAT